MKLKSTWNLSLEVWEQKIKSTYYLKLEVDRKKKKSKSTWNLKLEVGSRKLNCKDLKSTWILSLMLRVENEINLEFEIRGW